MPYNRHLDSSSVAQFPILFKGDKGEQASDRPKVTLHHSVLSLPDTETMRWRKGKATAPRNRLGGGASETELPPPPGELCVPTAPSRAPEAPAGPDCGGVGAKQTAA